MRWSDNRSLSSILDVHVLVVVTVSDALEAPSTAVLELAGNGPPEVLLDPLEGRSTVSSVDLEAVEGRGEPDASESECFPESDPLGDLGVLVDCLAKLKGECGIGVHGRGLNEWLELVTGMGRCSLKS